jgi:hypothetical protein
MSIVNRRNAILGWATWTVFKQVLRRGARSNAGAAREEPGLLTRLPWTDDSGETKKKAKKRSRRRILGFLVACAVGVGVWLGTRSGKESGELE